MYPTHDPTKFEQALSVSMDSRISKEKRNSILKLYFDGEWDRVRSRILNVFNVQGDVGKTRKLGPDPSPTPFSHSFLCFRVSPA